MPPKSQMKPADKPPTVKPKDTLRQIKMLVYGAFGSGKTHFCGTAAKRPEVFGRVLLISPDPGAASLAYDPEMNNNIDVAQIASLDDLNNWVEWLETVNINTNEYGTVILDGITDLGELALQEFLAETHKADSKRDPNLPGVDHWGRVNVVVRKFVRALRDLPIFVFMTALDKEIKDEASGRLFTRPAISGKLASELGAYFDLVGYITTGQAASKNDDTPRLVQFQPSERVTAKDRTRTLGNILENPTMGSVHDLIQAGVQVAPLPPTAPKVKQKTFGG